MKQPVNCTKICPKCKKEYPKKTTNCNDCKTTLMKKTTYGRIYDNHSYKIYVCPKCKKYHYPPTTATICEKCNIELIPNDNYQHNVKKQDKKINTVFTVVCIIIAILVFSYFISIFTSPSEPNIYTCARCNKTFTDSANTKSIARTNFCAKCYDDYKFISEVQKELDNW